MIEGLSTLSVKAVVGALYEGMGVVGGGGRVRIECLKLAGMLATQARGDCPRSARDCPRLSSWRACSPHAGAGHDGPVSARVHPSRHRVPQRLERKGAQTPFTPPLEALFTPPLRRCSRLGRKGPDGRRGGAARSLLVRAERRGRVDAARLHHRRAQEAGQDVRLRGGGADDHLLQPDGRCVPRPPLAMPLRAFREPSRSLRGPS